MKITKTFFLMFFLLPVFDIYSQTNAQKIKWQNEITANADLYKREYKTSVVKYNFSPLWTKTVNSAVYGFIGDDYQRLRIKILSAAKSKNSPDTYLVSGKSMVKNNVCDFSGTIKITSAKIFKNMHWGVDDEYKNAGIKRQGIILAEYRFAEDKSQTHSGVFQGTLSTGWYIDKNGKLQYDDIESNSDGYRNNQFLGTWKSYKNKSSKNANWGDYRIPFSGDLDIGAGEFSPMDKYLQFGWQIYRDAYFGNDKQARFEEEKIWWK